MSRVRGGRSDPGFRVPLPSTWRPIQVNASCLFHSGHPDGFLSLGTLACLTVRPARKKHTLA
jgi:hypothetical protein